MTEDQFWEMIDASRIQSKDCEGQARKLQHLLFESSAQDILAFDQRFRQKLIDAYRWDLWGIAYLINGSCSAKGMRGFCCWLIGQGRQTYEQILREPESILRWVEEDEEELGCEALMHVSAYAYDDVVGDDMPSSDLSLPEEPAGTPWKAQDLEKQFPKVAEVFVH